MKRLISILLLLLSFTCFAQLPKDIKCVEVASQVADTMVLINKPDLDKINTAFYRLESLDSLQVINEKLISNLENQNQGLNDIIDSQQKIIENQTIQIKNTKDESKDVISDLEKQVKSVNRKRTFWEFTTGLGVLGIIFLAIF